MGNDIDLHMHSVYSADGELAPAALVRLAKAAGIKTMAIADHNSIRGIAEGAAAARTAGIGFIPAVELNCVFHGMDIHLLGYGIAADSDELYAVDDALLAQERDTSEKLLRLAREKGLVIDEEKAWKLAPHGYVTGLIVAELAMKDRRNDALMADYLPGGSRGDNPYVNFFWDRCSRGKDLYVPLRFIELAEGVAVVRRAGGVPVLAHPGFSVGCRDDEVRAVCDTGIDGVEAYSSYHSEADTEYFLRWANENGKFITAGSDFHGKAKPAIALGQIDCEERQTEIYGSVKGFLMTPRDERAAAARRDRTQKKLA